MRDPLALKYNDKSVLENHHVSATFHILQNEKFNILQNFTREEYNKIRERMISMVLSTDMAFHFSHLAKLKGRLASQDFNIQEQDKKMCMDQIIHAADISNPIKPFFLCSKWTDKVLEEFWNQGDLERKAGFPISYLMDRYTVNIAKSQIGFIDVIVSPTFDVIKNYLPELTNYIPNFDTNKENWKTRIDGYDEKLSNFDFNEEILNEEKNTEMKEQKVE